MQMKDSKKRIQETTQKSDEGDSVQSTSLESINF